MHEAMLSSGLAVRWERDAASIRRLLEAGAFKLLCLDWAYFLNGGPDWLHALQAHRPSLVVIVVLDSAETANRALTDGADEFVVKTQDPANFVARIRARLRRANDWQVDVMYALGLSIDVRAVRVTHHGKLVPLSPTEFIFLVTLARHHCGVVATEQLARLVAGEHGYQSNGVAVHMSRLRRKLGSGLIRTIRGRGYMLDTGSSGNLAGRTWSRQPARQGDE